MFRIIFRFFVSNFFDFFLVSVLFFTGTTTLIIRSLNFDINFTIYELTFFICCTFLSTFYIRPSTLFSLRSLVFITLSLFLTETTRLIFCRIPTTFFRDSNSYTVIFIGFNFLFLFFFSDLLRLVIQVLDTRLMFFTSTLLGLCINLMVFSFCPSLFTFVINFIYT